MTQSDFNACANCGCLLVVLAFIFGLLALLCGAARWLWIH